MRLSALIAAICLAAITAGAAERPNAPAVLVLPFADCSGEDSAPGQLAKQVAAQLEARGWRTIGADAVEPILEEERVRYLDSIDDAVRKRLVDTTGAAAVLSATVLTYLDGKNPIVAVSARLVRADGTLQWADVAALSADDVERPFGFGRVTTADALAAFCIDELLHDFPRPGDAGAAVRGRRKPLFHGGPVAFRDYDLDPATPHKICILPFNNTTTSSAATRVVADIFAARLAAESGFEVVQPAQLRAAAVQTHVASFRTATSPELERLVPLVGTTLFLSGTIYAYHDAATAADPPSIEIEATLIDVQTHRVLWIAQQEHVGTDYYGLFMRGAASNAVTLADRTVSEMIRTASGRGGRKPSEGRVALRRVPEQHSRLRGASGDK